jgi:hypothetical protein
MNRHWNDVTAEQTALFPRLSTDICSEKRILEQHKSEWEDFRSVQGEGRELAKDTVDLFQLTSPSLANLKEFERRGNSPILVSPKTSRTPMERGIRTSRRLTNMRTGLIGDESKLDDSLRFPFVENADGDLDAMRIDDLDPIQTKTEEPQDEMCNDTVDEALLVSQKSWSQFVNSQRLNMSDLQVTSSETESNIIPTSNSKRSPDEFFAAYSEVLQKWMEDRRRWEKCKKAYEVKLKSAVEDLREQGISTSRQLYDMKLERQSADLHDLQEKLKFANNKVAEIEKHLQIKGDRVKYLEERCKAFESREDVNREKWSNNTVIIVQLKKKLDTLKHKLEEAQKSDNPKLKKLKLKLSKSKKTIQELQEKVEKQERDHTDLKRKFNFEVQNGERLETTITRLTNENVSLREDKQRLHLIKIELETVKSTIKHHEENELKLQELKLENIGFRKSNSILTEQLKLLEGCNRRFTLQLECQKSEPTDSQFHQTKICIPRKACNSPREKWGISPGVNSVEVSIPSANQKPSPPQMQTQNERTRGNNYAGLKSPELSSLKHTKNCSSLPGEKPHKKSDNVPQSLYTSPVSQPVALPASCSSPQLCKRDVLFLKSLKEVLTRHVEATSKDKNVQTKLDEGRKFLNSHLGFSQGNKIRRRSNSTKSMLKSIGAHTDSAFVDSLRGIKGNKGNRVKRNRWNYSYSTASKARDIRKSALPTRKTTLKAF